MGKGICTILPHIPLRIKQPVYYPSIKKVIHKIYKSGILNGTVRVESKLIHNFRLTIPDNKKAGTSPDFQIITYANKKDWTKR